MAEEDQEDELEAGRMPLLDHLTELRTRLLWSFGAIIIAFLVEVAHGHSGSPYSWLGAIAGIAYLAAVIIFRVRG